MELTIYKNRLVLISFRQSFVVDHCSPQMLMKYLYSGVTPSRIEERASNYHTALSTPKPPRTKLNTVTNSMKAATTVLAFLAATPSVFSAVISTANSTADIYQLFARGNPEYTCKPIEKKEDYCKGITEQFCSDNVKCEDTMVNGCPRPMTWIKSFNECSPMAVSSFLCCRSFPLPTEPLR